MIEGKKLSKSYILTKLAKAYLLLYGIAYMLRDIYIYVYIHIIMYVRQNYFNIKNY